MLIQDQLGIIQNFQTFSPLPKPSQLGIKTAQVYEHCQILPGEQTNPDPSKDLVLLCNIYVYPKILSIFLILTLIFYSHRCRFCNIEKNNEKNLKQHVLNHFKDQLNKNLPSCKPLLCPDCQASFRDKTTRLRSSP